MSSDSLLQPEQRDQPRGVTGAASGSDIASKADPGSRGAKDPELRVVDPKLATPGPDQLASHAQDDESKQEPALAPDDAARSGWAIAGHVAAGLAVWGSLFFWLFQALPAQQVEILLGITPGETLKISGEVLERARNRPASGRVQLVVDNPKQSEHRVSSVIPVANGRFAADYDLGKHGDDSPEALRVTAHFLGSAVGGPALQGRAVAYANCSSPIHADTLVKAFFGLAALALLMIILFTADVTQETAKFLFGAAYLTCFLSVTAPLAMLLVVSDNRYLIELMRDSPAGLVQANAQGIEHRQWFVNLGGVVKTAPAAEAAAAASESATAAVQPSEAAAEPNAPSEPSLPPRPPLLAAGTQSADTKSGAEPDQAASQPASAATAAARSPSHRSPETDRPQAQVEPSYVIEGGLAIPFFVIILAVLGGGISMMRNVPNIQKKHLGDLNSSGGNPVLAVLTLLITPFLRAPTKKHEHHHAGCDVRKEIIDQYMYLLSAPFLAVAVYYLLQVIAENVAEPVLVLMAFSTGLISERIVGAIVALANRTLAGSQPDPKSEP